MSKDYFKPIKFNEEKKEEVKEEFFPSKEAWTPLIMEIYQEISKIEAGCSTFRKGAMTFRANAPVRVGLNRFGNNPTKNNLALLLVVLPQDLGAAGEHYAKKLTQFLKEKRNERA